MAEAPKLTKPTPDKSTLTRVVEGVTNVSTGVAVGISGIPSEPPPSLHDMLQPPVDAPVWDATEFLAQRQKDFSKGVTIVKDGVEYVAKIGVATLDSTRQAAKDAVDTVASLGPATQKMLRIHGSGEAAAPETPLLSPERVHDDTEGFSRKSSWREQQQSTIREAQQTSSSWIDPNADTYVTRCRDSLHVRGKEHLKVQRIRVVHFFLHGQGDTQGLTDIRSGYFTNLLRNNITATDSPSAMYQRSWGISLNEEFYKDLNPNDSNEGYIIKLDKPWGEYKPVQLPDGSTRSANYQIMVEAWGKRPQIPQTPGESLVYAFNIGTRDVKQYPQLGSAGINMDMTGMVLLHPPKERPTDQDIAEEQDTRTHEETHAALDAIHVGDEQDVLYAAVGRFPKRMGRDLTGQVCKEGQADVKSAPVGEPPPGWKRVSGPVVVRGPGYRP